MYRVHVERYECCFCRHVRHTSYSRLFCVGISVDRQCPLLGRCPLLSFGSRRKTYFRLYGGSRRSMLPKPYTRSDRSLCCQGHSFIRFTELIGERDVSCLSQVRVLGKKADRQSPASFRARCCRYCGVDRDRRGYAV